jgi:hypothetical protein
MSEREKALEAALRLARDMLASDYQRLGIVPVEALVIRTIDAAIAMPATVNRAMWEADGDVQHIVDAVWAEYADSVKDRWTFRKEHIENAINRAIAIRNLTPPEGRE